MGFLLPIQVITQILKKDAYIFILKYYFSGPLIFKILVISKSKWNLFSFLKVKHNS